MKRIKVGIALMTMFSLLLGTSGIALAKAAPIHHPKVSTKITHHATKSNVTTKSLSKTVKSKKNVKTVKLSKAKTKTKQSTVHA
jgi:hypothetical protein